MDELAVKLKHTPHGRWISPWFLFLSKAILPRLPMLPQIRQIG
jgi:hypothetical protein